MLSDFFAAIAAMIFYSYWYRFLDSKMFISVYCISEKRIYSFLNSPNNTFSIQKGNSHYEIIKGTFPFLFAVKINSYVKINTNFQSFTGYILKDKIVFSGGIRGVNVYITDFSNHKTYIFTLKRHQKVQIE